MAPVSIQHIIVSLTVITSISDLHVKSADKCEFNCPNKDETPWHPKGAAFTSNGCGSMGIQVKLDERVEGCCDTHDACYAVCGISRNFCDLQFNKCIKKRCKGDEECIHSAGMITMGVQLFGCEPFLKAQRDGCDCLKPKELEEGVMQTLRELYEKLPEENQKTEEQLIELKEKYWGKEYKLINKILNKYPKHLIEMEQMPTGRSEL